MEVADGKLLDKMRMECDKLLLSAQCQDAVNMETPSNAYAKWVNALLLPGERNLYESSLCEASEFFSIPRSEAAEILNKAIELYADEWRKKDVNTLSDQSLADFYNTSRYEIFELLSYHARENSEAAGLYVAALQIAKDLGCLQILDYGCRISSGCILFARNGLSIALADISTPVLEFSKWRLSRRGIEANFVDLKNEDLAADRYDLITCFDVLEHLRDPLKVLQQIRRALKPNGVAVIHAPFGEDAARPMHIYRQKKKAFKRIRSVGFSFAIDLMRTHNPAGKSRFGLKVLRKVKRSLIAKSAVLLWDCYFPAFAKRKEIRKCLR